MAHLNITLSQEEILLLMSQDREGAFKKLLQESLNQIMQAESAEPHKAQPYERSSDRVDSRNGSYTRELTTRIGTITLTVPRHRNVPFKTMVFDNYSTSEGALITTMAEMVVNGVATRKVGRVMEELCGRNFSKSTVSETCKELDKEVEKFRNRLLTEEYPFVTVDATYFSVRVDHKVIKKALFIAYAVNSQGKRDILGFSSYPSETKENWKDFLQWLKNKGLSGVKMFISDAHDGIRYGISQVFPFVPWQRCQYHFLKNIIQKVPLKYQKGLSSELTEMFMATSGYSRFFRSAEDRSFRNAITRSSNGRSGFAFFICSTVSGVPTAYCRSLKLSCISIAAPPDLRVFQPSVNPEILSLDRKSVV